MNAELFLQGEKIENVKVLLLQGNEITLELQQYVFDDMTYQILINGNQHNLEFIQINSSVQINQPVYYHAKGFMFR